MSDVELTVKVVEAWAGGATKPAANEGNTKAAATNVAARAPLALRVADPRNRSTFCVCAGFVIA